MLVVAGRSDNIYTGKSISAVGCACVVARSKHLQGTKAPKTNPQSIMEFVNKMNHLFRVPLLSSPLDSAQPTLPAGYSPIEGSQLLLGRKRINIEGRVARTSNADTDKEPPGGQHVEHSNRLTLVVGSSGQSGKDNQNQGGHHEELVRDQ